MVVLVLGVWLSSPDIAMRMDFLGETAERQYPMEEDLDEASFMKRGWITLFKGVLFWSRTGTERPKDRLRLPRPTRL